MTETYNLPHKVKAEVKPGENRQDHMSNEAAATENRETHASHAMR